MRRVAPAWLAALGPILVRLSGLRPAILPERLLCLGDCSQFDVPSLRPRQHAELDETHADHDQSACGKIRGLSTKSPGSGATAAGGASSRASAAPPRVPSMTDSSEVKVLYSA